MLEINATSGDKRRRDGEVLRLAAGGAPNPVENAVAIPETDPERIAFNLWNEGRVDEAIQFLEREIATRKDGPDGQPAGEIKPISDWRDRHRALGSADFNAFGTSARTIDLVAGPADAILPHPPRRRMRPIWIMGICLAVIGISSAAALWSSRAGPPEETALATVEPTVVKSEPVAPARKPKPYIAAAGEESGATPVKPVAHATAATTPAAAEEAPPPDEEAAPSDVAANEMPAPETTTSIGLAGLATEAPETTQAPPVVEARLPRQRPEPPAQPTPAQPTTLARVDQQDPPEIYTPPASDDVYSAQASNDAGPGDFDPNNPPPRLTPAEYQALLERRAWAENYVSRRRAYAERRAQLEEPEGFLGSRGPFIRWQDD